MPAIASRARRVSCSVSPMSFSPLCANWRRVASMLARIGRDGLVVSNRSKQLLKRSAGTRRLFKSMNEACSSPAMVLWMLPTDISAPHWMAGRGISGWNGKCGPQASSTTSGFPAAWQISASRATSGVTP